MAALSSYITQFINKLSNLFFSATTYRVPKTISSTGAIQRWAGLEYAHNIEICVTSTGTNGLPSHISRLVGPPSGIIVATTFVHKTDDY
ncbi:hypothetical protein RCL_jg12754.t1 [Rhizophagus clarus]|uniref:Uncharacterized protein n=1 Tax=Rhizophagus clarus TaxID=94130 RepID=A0A8H3KWM4_9GLOM|nr:hypothetical protein RCL_jg12754.t1 [Rhizophagus clarus]